MAATESSAKIIQALTQPNKALKKRALALIHHQVLREAAPHVERFLGVETDPELVALGVRVLAHLQDHQPQVETLGPEELRSHLRADDANVRRKALRILGETPEPQVLAELPQLFAAETEPRCLHMVLELFQRFPHPDSLSILVRSMVNDDERVRREGLLALLKLFTGDLFPRVLATLLDDSSAVKMLAHQFVATISRNHLLEALEAMMMRGGEPTAIAAQLLPSFLSHDMLPLLKRGLGHAQADVRELCRESLIRLEQKGDPEAALLLEELERIERTPGVNAVPDAAPALSTASTNVGDETGMIGLLETLGEMPEWLVLTLKRALAESDPVRGYGYLSSWSAYVTEWLAVTFIVAYLARGRRDPDADRLALGTIHFGSNRVDVPRLLLHLANRLPAPRSEHDLFPLLMAPEISRLEDDAPLLARLVELREGLACLQDYPDRAAELTPLARQSAAALLAALKPATNNRLILRHTSGNELKLIDLLRPQPLPIDTRTVNAERFAVNRPFLCSLDLDCEIPLFPFFTVTRDTLVPLRNQPTDQDLWDFLSRYGALDDFMTYLFSVVRPDSSP